MRRMDGPKDRPNEWTEGLSAWNEWTDGRTEWKDGWITGWNG